MTIPALHTPRLVLRPFALDDAPVVKRLTGEGVVLAMNTARTNASPPDADPVEINPLGRRR